LSVSASLRVSTPASHLIGTNLLLLPLLLTLHLLFDRLEVRIPLRLLFPKLSLEGALLRGRSPLRVLLVLKPFVKRGQLIRAQRHKRGGALEPTFT